MKTPRLSDNEIATRRGDVSPQWSVDNGDTLRRTFTFADFKDAMQFVNGVAQAAEAADHHPDLDIRYNKVTVALSTHDSGGLTEKDFSLAAVADTIGTAG